MAVAETPQTAMDERVLDASNLEAALDEREKRKAAAGALRKQFKEADDKVKALLSEFDLQDGEVGRCGNYRIEKKGYQGRSVSFETSPSSRLRISVINQPVQPDE